MIELHFEISSRSSLPASEITRLSDSDRKLFRISSKSLRQLSDPAQTGPKTTDAPFEAIQILAKTRAHVFKTFTRHGLLNHVE